MFLIVGLIFMLGWLTNLVMVAQESVGIGTDTPHPSALLHLNSLDKGLLIPRTDTTTVNNAGVPAVGLMIYDFGDSALYYFDGLRWRILSGNQLLSISGDTLTISNGNSVIIRPTYTYAVGDLDLGGIVFYVNATGTHGLVAATQNQSEGTDWYNVQDIISNAANHNTAGQEYSDWRIPTKHELSLMYTGLHLNSLGSFSNNTYWSSTEINDTSMWGQTFLNGTQTNENKTFFNFVRAVRSF